MFKTHHRWDTPELTKQTYFLAKFPLILSPRPSLKNCRLHKEPNYKKVICNLNMNERLSKPSGVFLQLCEMEGWERVEERTSLYVKQMMEGFVNKHWCKNKQSFSGKSNNAGTAMTMEDLLASLLKENSGRPSSHTAPSCTTAGSQRGGTPWEAQPSQGKLSSCICNKQLFTALQCWTRGCAALPEAREWHLGW